MATPYVSVARWSFGPEGWRFVDRAAMRLVVLEGSSRSLYRDRDAGPPWLRFTRGADSIRLPLDEVVRVVEGRGVRIAPGTYRFSWRGAVLRHCRGAGGRVVRKLVHVELVVPVDRDGGRVERTVLWIATAAERFEIELNALRQALPDRFVSETPSDGPSVQQVQRLLIGQGSAASRAPVRRRAGEVPARPEPTPPRRRGWAGPTVAALLAYALLGEATRAEMVFVTGRPKSLRFDARQEVVSSHHSVASVEVTRSRRR